MKSLLEIHLREFNIDFKMGDLSHWEHGKHKVVIMCE